MSFTDKPSFFQYKCSITLMPLTSCSTNERATDLTMCDSDTQNTG